MTTALRYVIETRAPGPCGYADCDIPGHTQMVYSYSLPSGEAVTLVPGDVYFSVHKLDEGPCEWDNCDGRHLYCVLPSKNTHHWRIDGRASNCTLKNDRLHRCWVRHGDPTNPSTLHVDKKGLTCNAGAGSIAADGWHGFLHNGVLTP